MDRAGRREVRPAPRRRGARCWRAAISMRSARCTSPSATACTSIHVAADLSDSRARVLLLGGRHVLGAAVRPRRDRRFAGGWLTDYLARTRGLRDRALRLGFASFLTCGSGGALDRRPAPVAKAVLLAFALGVGRLRAGRVLGGLPRHRLGARRRGHRVHEHIRKSRRPDRPAGRRLCGRPLAFVDVPLLRDRAVYAAGALAWLVIQPDRRIADC